MPLRCKVFARLNNCANCNEADVSFVQTQKKNAKSLITFIHQNSDIKMSQHYQGPFWALGLNFLWALTKFWGQLAQGPALFQPVLDCLYIFSIPFSESCYLECSAREHKEALGLSLTCNYVDMSSTWENHADIDIKNISWHISTCYSNQMVLGNTSETMKSCQTFQEIRLL